MKSILIETLQNTCQDYAIFKTSYILNNIICRTMLNYDFVIHSTVTILFSCRLLGITKDY